ncbi:MAG: S4 domain-containing protein [Ghiorsea sp.]
MDKWLWAARFFKMRNLATEAAKAGHILINGDRCKASKLVHISDTVQITKESEVFIVEVLGLAEKRGSASIAQALYQETEQSSASRIALRKKHQFQTLHAPSPNKKPDKRARRKITNFKLST